MKNKDKGIVNCTCNILGLAIDIRKKVDIDEKINRKEMRMLVIAIMDNAIRVLESEEKINNSVKKD